MSNKTLKKSNDKVIAGVCAGIAEHLGWKPSHARLAFVVATILGASGVIAYIILLFVMPNANHNETSSFDLEDFKS